MAEGVPVGRARYTMTCGVCVNCFKFISTLSTLLNHSPNVKNHMLDAYYKRGDSDPASRPGGDEPHRILWSL